MADTLQGLGNQLQGYAAAAANARQSNQALNLSFGSLFSAVSGAALGFRAIDHVARQTFEHIPYVRELSHAWQSLSEPLHSVRERQNQLNTEASRLRAIRAGAIVDDNISIRQATSLLETHERELEILRLQTVAHEHLTNIFRGRNWPYLVFLAAMGRTLDQYYAINKALVEANSLIQERVKLSQQAFNIQAQTGAQLHTVTDASRALVRYGYAYRDNFAATLKTVVMMREALGISVDEGSELAVIFERQLSGSVKSIADAITQVVEDTALAANEAARFAINIGRAVAALRPGLKADLGAITELVGRYEGTIKGLGGVQGQLTDLLTRLTRPEGLMQAGLIGGVSPDFLQSAEATQRVIRGIGDYMHQFLGNTQGWDRALRLQALGELFNTTGEQVALMDRAIRQTNLGRGEQITLEERYHNQMRVTGQNISMLISALQSLVYQSLAPFTEYLGLITGALAEAAKWLARNTAVIKTLTVSFLALGLAAVPFIIRETALLGRALLRLAMKMRATALSAEARAAAESTGSWLNLGGASAAGNAAALSRASWLGRIIGWSAGFALRAFLPVGLAFLAAAIGKEVAKAYMAADDLKNAPITFADAKSLLEEAVLQASYNRDLGAIQNALDRYRRIKYLENMSATEAATAIDRFSRVDLPRIIGEARFKQAIAAGTVPSAEDRAEAKRMEQFQVDSLSEVRRQREISAESFKLQKHQFDEEARREKAREDREKMEALRISNDPTMKW